MAGDSHARQVGIGFSIATLFPAERTIENQLRPAFIVQRHSRNASASSVTPAAGDSPPGVRRGES